MYTHAQAPSPIVAPAAIVAPALPLRSWRVESGRATLFAAPTSGGVGGAQTLFRRDAKTRKITRLVDAGLPIVSLQETRSERGRTVFVVLARAPAASSLPTTLLLHPTLGVVFRRAGARPFQVRFGMARLDTFALVQAAAATNKEAKTPPRPAGRETVDFDRLIDRAFSVARFVGTFTSALETIGLDGVPLRLLHTLHIESDGSATLTSALAGGGAGVGGSGTDLSSPLPARLTRRFGTVLTSLVARNGLVRGYGVFRPLPPAPTKSAAATGVLYLSTLGDGANAERIQTTLHFSRKADTTERILAVEHWDVLLYGDTPPPFVPLADRQPIVASPAGAEGPSAPFLGRWQGQYVGAKEQIYNATLELLPDRTARLTVQPATTAKNSGTIPAAAAAPTVPTISTGTWAILDDTFAVRFTTRGGENLSAPDRLTFARDGAELAGVTWDRTRYGTRLRFVRAPADSAAAAATATGSPTIYAANGQRIGTVSVSYCHQALSPLIFSWVRAPAYVRYAALPLSRPAP